MQRIDPASLGLTAPVAAWVGEAALYGSSGCSGAVTVFVDRDGGAYLKIAEAGLLLRSAEMQRFFHRKGLSSQVLLYESGDRDYLITAPVRGEDGIAPHILAEPERISALFGESLRALHAVDTDGCPVRGRTAELLRRTRTAAFLQAHLDIIDTIIGPARADRAASEIAEAEAFLRSDVLIHGDYCLPNIMIENWRWTGFIDLGESGLGDPHYDLAWGLWTLSYNLRGQAHLGRFLDAYGRDAIDKDRLRTCGLMMAMD